MYTIMPLKGRWRKFDRQTINRVSEDEGVYELATEKQNITYIGSSTNLRRRIATHLLSGKMKNVAYFKCQVASPLDIASIRIKEQSQVLKLVARTGRKPRKIKRTPRRDPLFDL